MSVFQTIIISALTIMVTATFGSFATYVVNRYAPRFFDHLEKKVKKK